MSFYICPLIWYLSVAPIVNTFWSRKDTPHHRWVYTTPCVVAELKRWRKTTWEKTITSDIGSKNAYEHFIISYCLNTSSLNQAQFQYQLPYSIRKSTVTFQKLSKVRLNEELAVKIIQSSSRWSKVRPKVPHDYPRSANPQIISCWRALHLADSLRMKKTDPKRVSENLTWFCEHWSDFYVEWRR